MKENACLCMFKHTTAKTNLQRINIISRETQFSPLHVQVNTQNRLITPIASVAKCFQATLLHHRLWQKQVKSLSCSLIELWILMT